MTNSLCVFCGERPEEKTKEHVIPQWLIQRTGDPKRRVFLGLRWGSIERPGEVPGEHAHAFDQFTFPACAACNSKFSKLEGETASTFDRLSGGEPIGAAPLTLLLDWFDKVRVGLWLGGRVLGTNPMKAVQPKFHISDRVGSSDRLLFISRMTPEVGKGLTYFGVGTPMFGLMPSVFGLRANNLMFVNASSGSILARRLGLPFGEDVQIRSPKGVSYEGRLNGGTGRTQFPVIAFRYPLPAFSVLQPLYAHPLLPELSDLFRAPVVEKYIRDRETLEGHLLTPRGASIERVHGVGAEEYRLMQVDPHPRIPQLLSKAVLELQNVIGHGPFWGGQVTRDQHLHRCKQMAMLRRLNRFLLKNIE